MSIRGRGLGRTILLLCSALAPLCLSLSCKGTNDVAIADGSYPLATVNGKSLPFDEGPEPPRPGASGSCHSLLLRGELLLQRANQTFEFWYEHGSTCTDRTLGRSGATGTYRELAGGLELVAVTGPGLTETYRASISRNTISVASRYYSLGFAR
ncbi:MAG: hypothetical protein IT361_00675 [Gemmatimonadaceae bacterium]|nr:hypothetical protein [Gemmatimonadaceae bacterium]